jgi:CHAD domain-containing protein
VKARTVEGLDRKTALEANARLLVRVRVAELYSFAPAALDERETVALHDMRIAAKRLRYLLELFGFCFDGYVARAQTHARRLHSLIGEVHDCDVFLARLEGLGEQAAPLRERYRGLRRERFAAFVAYWQELEEEDLRTRLVAAIEETPATLSV